MFLLSLHRKINQSDMDKQPKLMDFSRMRDILDPLSVQMHEQLFINSELAILHGDPKVFRLILQQQPPFTIDDYRLGLVARGDMWVNVNLVEKHITSGMLVFIGPGSIISPLRFSPDLEIYGIGLSSEFPMPFAPGQLPTAFNGQVRDFQLPVSAADMAIARHIVDTIWHIVGQHDYNRQTVSCLVAAQMHHYNSLYCSLSAQMQATRSREQTLFDRFVYLVNQSATRQHHLAFYAEKMCLTERYLSTVVRQASGATAKEWIDRALILRIKAALKHTDKTIAQISEEMNFGNPAFFSKYFKRLTGQTPLAYRAG